MKKTGLCNFFSVDYRHINTNEISDNHRFLIKKNIKCFELFKKKYCIIS